MITSKFSKDKIDVELERGHLHFRFCNVVDQKLKDFEDQRIRSKPLEIISIHDDTHRDISWPNISYWQSYQFIENQDSPFYFLQMSNNKVQTYYQLAITIEVSKIAFFQIGTIHKWIMSTNESSVNDQAELFKQLTLFCHSYTKLMSLRVQPYMPGETSLSLASNLLSLLGFVDAAPKSYIKTRMIDLRPSLEELLSSFSANGRARLKIKARDLDQVAVKEINNPKVIPFLQKALNASFKRSVSKNCSYNFMPLFLNVAKKTKAVAMMGFYFNHSPDEPKAFVTGIHHSNIVEYSVGGSVSDQELRQFPFNHILIWQLALRSKQNGAHYLDMGGITSGDKEDALQGISNFKRFFPGFELFTGREMILSLRPKHIFFYYRIQQFINFIKKTSRLFQFHS